MTNKEEEQLLQDASTLLMFANVAAKQQQQHIKNVSPPPQQQSQSTTHSPVLSANTASPVSVNISPSLAPVGTLPGILHQQETHPAPGDVTVTATPSSSTVTSTTSSENIAPPPNGFASPMAGAAVPNFGQYPPNKYGTPTAAQPYSIPANTASAVIENSKNNTKSPPTRIPSLTQETNIQTQPRQTAIHPPTTVQPPAVKSSISILMNSPEPQQMPFPIQTTKVQPPVLVPYNLPISSRKSVSPPSSYNSNLPSKGSFTQNHKRSKSTPETDKRPVSAYRKILLSPGTANVTLARGINLQTGERNTNNAVIAAAALAAAADNPLPLKHLVENSITIEKVEEKKKRAVEQVLQQNNSNSSSSTGTGTGTSTSSSSESETDQAIAVRTKEEDQTTEPENDEKTDDEKTDVEDNNDTNITKKADTVLETPVTIKEEKQDKIDIELQPHTEHEASKSEAIPEGNIEQQQSIEQEPDHNNKQLEKEKLETEADDTKIQEQDDEEEQEEEESKAKGVTFSVPPLSSYQVDPDSGLIGCICGIIDDDGFTIQCDVCYRWQHCVCMGFKTSDEVPEDEYSCYYCDEQKWGKFDPSVCRYKTLERLGGEFSRAPSTSQEFEQIQLHAQKQVELQQRQRQEQQNQHLEESDDAQDNKQKQQNTGAGTKRKQSNSEKSDKKRKVEAADKQRKDNILAMDIPVKSQSPVDMLPNKENELLDDGITAESYQSVYYKLRSNDYKKQSIREFLSKEGIDFFKEFSALPKEEQGTGKLRGITVMPLSQFKAIKLSKLILPNQQKFLNEHNKITASKNTNVNTTAIQVKQYSDNQKQKFNGISKLSLFVSTTSNESLTIAENTPIIEYMGEIDLFKNYVRDPVNQYSTWGVTKPKVLKSTLQTHENEPLDIVLDSRFVGNESRFIRKSCPTSSNCRIERIYIPEDNSFRFLVVTTKPIKLKSETADEELRLEWEWDPEHPILKLYKNNNSEKFELLSNADKSALITYIDNILHFAECGCSTANGFSTCAIFKIKKATSYLLRSTRKASSISNVNLTKSKEELILPRREKEYISWNERLLERDNIIQMNLSVTADESDEEMIEEKEAEVVGTKESDVEEYVKEPKPTALFKLPYKKQLISKNRNLLRNMEKIESNHVKVEPSSYITDDDLPFPIVSDLVIRIEKNIDEKLKPMVQEVEEKISTVLESLPMVTEEEKPVAVIDIVKVVEEVKAQTLKSVDTDNIKQAPTVTAPVVVDNEKKEVVKEEPAPVQQPSPKIVKKLSFADYKKKLK